MASNNKQEPVLLLTPSTAASQHPPPSSSAAAGRRLQPCCSQPHQENKDKPVTVVRLSEGVCRTLHQGLLWLLLQQLPSLPPCWFLDAFLLPSCPLWLVMLATMM
jgi:hypothetical protein